MSGQLAVHIGDGFVCQVHFDQRRPDPARIEGSVGTRPMVERNVAKGDQAAHEVRHWIEYGVRQHLGALTNPEHGTMSHVRSNGQAPVLRE
jgi:hypothetical protein